VPTYQYRCTGCGEELEVVQKFSDQPLTVCPACQGSLRKVFAPVGIVFKGSGFYRTDSRNGSGAGSGDGAKKDKEPAGKSADSPDSAKSSANGSSSSSPSSSSSSESSGASGSSGKSAEKSSSTATPAASKAG
jgi:putative FmdB family regulatory protein